MPPAHPGELPPSEGPFDWLRELFPRGRHAFAGHLRLLCASTRSTTSRSRRAWSHRPAHFGLGGGQTGLLTTVTLGVRAIGGAVAGVVADRIGRVKAVRAPPTAATIDLIADLDEGFDRRRLDDEEPLSVVTSTHVACGFHAGGCRASSAGHRIGLRTEGPPLLRAQGRNPR